MKFYTTILFILLAPLILHHGIQAGGLIENDVLRLLAWCVLLITMGTVLACRLFALND